MADTARLNDWRQITDAGFTYELLGSGLALLCRVAGYGKKLLMLQATCQLDLHHQRADRRNYL